MYIFKKHCANRSCTRRVWSYQRGKHPCIEEESSHTWSV